MAPPIDYLLIGHVTADITPDGRKLGGTVSYAARTAAAFGLRVGILTSAAPTDPLLDKLTPYITELCLIPADATSTFENVYTPQGRQQIIRAVAAPLQAQHIPPTWHDAPLVHLGPLTGEIDPFALLAHFPHARTMLTAQGLLRQWGADGRVHFKRWADQAALAALGWLVLSEEDIATAPGLEATYASATAHTVITRAENGGTYYINGQPHPYTTPQVHATHPTGAGDVFAAGLLASLHLLDGDTQPAIQIAAQLGATAVTRPGWEGAPTPDEIQAQLAAARGKRHAP